MSVTKAPSSARQSTAEPSPQRRRPSAHRSSDRSPVIPSGTGHLTPRPTGPAYVQLPQLKSRVSSPGEPLEREADEVSSRVTSGSAPTGVVALTSTSGRPARQTEPDEEPIQRQTEPDEEPIQRQTEPDDEPIQRQTEPDDEPIQRQTEPDEEPIQRQTEPDDEPIQRQSEGRTPGRGVPTVTPRTAGTISNPGRGTALAPSVRRAVEPHVGAGLGGVRVHTDGNAAHAATSLNARAFTVGYNIFLNSGESPTNLGLMAHESTHVVQQGAGLRSPTVARLAAGEEIQRLPGFITDRLASYARHVPGYTLFTVIIGFNPLTGSAVERNAMNLVEGLMGLVPFGTLIFDKLVEHGILQDAFAFISRQLASFDLSLERLERTISEAWDEMDFIRLDPFDYNLGVLRKHAGRLLDDVTGFAASVVNHIIELIKEVALRLAEGLLAENRAWDLLKKVIKWDPLRGEAVEATTVEIIEDFLILIGKETELEQMRARGTVEKTAEWIDTQLATFTGLISELGSLFSAAWDAIQPENLPNLASNLESLVIRAGAFVQRVWDFAITVASQVLQLIKDALLGWLASFANDIPGFHLLTVLLGRNPFTGEAVARDAVNIIRGFISLLPGGNAMYEKLAQTGVVADAGAQIEGAIAELGISWEFVVGIFTGVWDSLSIDDLIDPIGAFQRIVDRFGEPISRLFAFIKTVMVEMFKLILALMNFPSELLARIVSNVIAAITDIMRDPIGFLINMLEAVKLGFSNFFDNILTHLLNGLVEWLFGGLREAGIEPPADLSLESILDTVLQVLGITMERIWEKLAERFGQDTVDKIRGAIDRLVGIWNFVNDVMERGVAAIWEYIESQLSNLWNMILGAATEWIMGTIISRVTAKLLSMLDPTGIMAVVNGFIAFFNAIQSAIQYIREILEIVDSYVGTFAAIAAGDIEPGAARMEGGLAAVIPVALGFLANQVGLGSIGPKIAEIIGGVREVVDQALDWLMDRLEAAIESIKSLFGIGGDQADADEAQATENAGVDPADHQAFAQHAARRLEQAELSGEGSTLDQLRAAAAALQVQLSNQLENGIGLRYNFPGGEADASDGRVSVEVVIAPNTTQQVVTINVPAGVPGFPNPGTPAPGIGTIGSHGSQPPRNTDGPRIHHTESEHIIPFAIGNQLLIALGLSPGDRRAQGNFDRAQTTLMIYERAADHKTADDQRIIDRFKTQAADAKVAQRLERAEQQSQIEGGGIPSDGRAAMADIVTALNTVRDDAISRTREAIDWDHLFTEPGANAPNGVRRGEESRNPSGNSVGQAARQQYDEIFAVTLQFFENRGPRPIEAPDPADIPTTIEEFTLGDVNSWDQVAQWRQVPNVTESVARAIIAGRPYSTEAEFAAVRGVGRALLGRLVRG